MIESRDEKIRQKDQELARKDSEIRNQSLVIAQLMQRVESLEEKIKQ